jgi:hypothetical protein
LQLLGASLGLFLLAQLVLFRLYLPSRYVKWSVPLVLACAAAIGLVMLVEIVAGRVTGRARAPLVAGVALALGIGLALYPGHYEGAFVHDPHPSISAYLRTLPPNTLIAAPPAEADSVPSFTYRPVLISREHALAYHLGYYAELRQRADDLIAAYYAETPAEIGAFASRYGVGMLLVDRAAFHRETYADVWGGAPGEPWEPFTAKAGLTAQRARHFALLDLARHCGVADDGAVAAVPASCAVAER